VRFSTGTLPTDKKFTGQRLDNTGLYYYGARYYDPVIGRFISPDTIVPDPYIPQSLNRYSYCLNNPLKFVDPSGHDTGDYDWYSALTAYAITRKNDSPQVEYITWMNNGGVYELYNANRQFIGKSDWNNLFDTAAFYCFAMGKCGFYYGAVGSPDIQTVFLYGEHSMNWWENGLYFISLAFMCAGGGTTRSTYVSQSFIKYEPWVNFTEPNTLVSQAEMWQKQGLTMTSKQADQLIVDLKSAGVKFRYDSGASHSISNPYKDIPHINVGKNYQFHIKVDPGWVPPSWVSRGD
jgi:RHS repeat-associated protein